MFGDLELLHTNVVRGGFSVVRCQEPVARSVSDSFFIGCILDGVANFTQESRQVLRTRPYAEKAWRAVTASQPAT